MRDSGVVKREDNVTMNRSKFGNSPHTPFEIHQINSTGKVRDSPTSSILKTPTAIFVTTRNSSAKTKKLKFANGPVDLQTLRNGTHDSTVSLDSSRETSEDRKLNNNGEIVFEESIVEVAISPVKTMQVSPESWKAFLEYKKYNDYANETEKTDYTYSRLSKYRHKEIIPGFLIRPNLSRSSISSRRSSLSLPSSHSSLNDSYQSGSYDFKVYNQPSSEIMYDFKTPFQSNKFTRSKYNLRSSNFDGSDIGQTDPVEVDSKSNYIENEYYSKSVPEKFTKSISYSTSETPEPTSHYYGKVRSMDLDDADIDEVDDNAVQYGKYYRSGEGRENYAFGFGGAGDGFGVGSKSRSDEIVWSQKNPQTTSKYIGNIFTTMFLYVTSVGAFTRDLFSKYVLRRQGGLSQPTSSGYWRRDNSGYATASGSWIPWGTEKAYPSTSYYSGGYYGQPRSWYQRVFYYFHDRFSNLTNFIWGNSVGYASSRYHETSNRRKFWWLLIPLLLLAGLWLFRAEQENGFISSQYKALDCRTNGLLTSIEQSIKPVWRSSYVAYKRAAASASCYVNDSWERLKLPFAHVNEWLCSRLSTLFGSSWGCVFTIWDTLWQGLRNALALTRDAFSNLYFTDGFFIITNGLASIFGDAWRLLTSALYNFKSYLYLLLFAPKRDVKYEFEMPEASRETCFKQQKSIEKLTSDMEDFKSITWDLSSIKKKIDDLELEFRKEKESRRSQNEFYNKQLDENHKTLQKYQATVNHALLSSKRPAHLSSSSIQYLLDNQSDFLKQWITQNFLLKSDSPGIDEKKIGLLMAKYSNKTGEELVALKREFGQFVKNHRNELESLRSNFNTLGANNLGGGDISVAFIKKLIADAIKLYDADKTGKVDYALETAGGQVQSVRCTETYIASPKSYVLLGWAVYTMTSSPRDAISPGMAAGQCWAFVGSQGFLVLQLSHTIRVTGFTMEHISRSLVPRGHIESAPKNFSMWGLKSEHDAEPHLFGEYAYLDNDETLQYFPVDYPTTEQYNMVELKITSNHGNPNYTCLYRIRVHGDLHPVQL